MKQKYMTPAQYADCMQLKTDTVYRLCRHYRDQDARGKRLSADGFKCIRIGGAWRIKPPS